MDKAVTKAGLLVNAKGGLYAADKWGGFDGGIKPLPQIKETPQ